jgi:hypothetical protein
LTNATKISLLPFVAALCVGCSSSSPEASSDAGTSPETVSAASVDASAPSVDTGAPSVDASAPSDALGPGVDAATNGKVAMFVAQGPLGRTIVSCDDGKTWVGNHSWDLDGDALMCGMVQPGMMCGVTMCSYLNGAVCGQHTCCANGPDAPDGVAFGDTALVSTWGHGAPGAVRKSQNGIGWTTTLGNFAASTPVAYGDGRFVITAYGAYAYAKYSTDGTTWTDGGKLNTPNGGGFRSMLYTSYGGGRFIGFTSNGGVNEAANTTRYIMSSSDGGVTWTVASPGLPTDCANGVGGGFVVGNGLLLIADQHGTVCTSADGGQTWKVTATGQVTIQNAAIDGTGALWTGTEFRFWGGNKMVSSTDGVSWATSTLIGTTGVGAVGRSDKGTFVSVVGSYSGQKFMTSSDGVTWQTLPSTSFVQSHPLRRISFGYAEPSALCPMP